MAIVTLDNKVMVSVHWNDTAWEADCAECGRVVFGKNKEIIKKEIQEHAC